MEKQYEVIIGLEVHVELNTKSKIFCGCSTSFGGKVNSHTCPVCTGMPGSLPVLNKQVVEYATAVGIATNCSITQFCKFDRKNYFYPDNPQNYQISQLYLPICRNGYVTINVDGDEKNIRIHEIHMEEDASKLIHDPFTGNTLVDCNRSGVPLIEIVSEPDMRSDKEVIAYLEKLRMLIQYLGVSDCKLQEGSMRADVNLSVREIGSKKMGTRTEMKNLNSFSAISRAVQYERERQIDIIESGGHVTQDSLRWDDEKGYSYSMRSKEDAKDYRYFPEPDLAPVIISDEWLEKMRKNQPEFRDEKIIRYKKEFDIPDYDIDIITNYKRLADIFEETISCGAQPKKVSNWLMGETMRLVKEYQIDIDKISFSPSNLAKLIELVDKKVITGNIAKKIFEEIFVHDLDPEEYVRQNSLESVNNENELREICTEIVKVNEKAVNDYLRGKEKAIGALVGQVMKRMKGRVDPSDVKNAIIDIIKV